MALGTLVESYEITTSESSAYQTPTSIVKAVISSAHLVNTGTESVKVTVWKTSTSTATTNDANKKMAEREIGVNETYLADELIGQYINQGGQLFVQADKAGVSLTVGGNTFKTEV